MRKLLAIAAIVALTASCSSKSPSSTTSPSPSGGATTVGATEKDFAISLDSANAKAGSLSFNVMNDGPSTHEFVIFKTDLAEDKLPLKSDGSAVDEEGAG